VLVEELEVGAEAAGRAGLPPPTIMGQTNS
jgi:hypothetical protein